MATVKIEEETLVDLCGMLRGDIGYMEKVVRSLMGHPDYEKEPFSFPHEMKAQTMLAVRALEDAHMRLGKVLEYKELKTDDYPEDPKAEPVTSHQDNMRNSLCLCGSGKKYKVCCGGKD